MTRRAWLVVAAAVLAAIPMTVDAASAEAPVPFNRAQLRVEINSTDGDAGLQIDLDHDPWRSIRLIAPDGRVLADVVNRGVLKGYGLTELFSESSEPPLTTFPLSKFKKLFPAGSYVLEGREIDGTPMRSTVALTHEFPAGPEITAPEEDATVGRSNVVIRWNPVTEPAGIDIVRYQVLVVDDRDPVHTLSLFLPASARSIAIPRGFLSPGDYKTEVLAIEKGGNQTLSEVAFSVR
jgi:hypothetical protein